MEQKFQRMADELVDRVEKQQQEQVQRLKDDQRRLIDWVSKYKADLKAARKEVEVDSLQ